jgi:hypothetical protein
MFLCLIKHHTIDVCLLYQAPRDTLVWELRTVRVPEGCPHNDLLGDLMWMQINRVNTCRESNLGRTARTTTQTPHKSKY